MKRRGHLATKINITFFMENEVLNMFSINSFFGKSNIFRENSKKQFWGYGHLLGGHHGTKKNIRLFIAIFVKAMLPEECAKHFTGLIGPFFRKMGLLMPKININTLITI